MAEVTAETDVFSSETDGRTLVFYRATVLHDRDRERTAPITDALQEQLRAWQAAGWRMSVAEMFGDTDEPTVYVTGFSAHFDIAGVMEAPSLDDAYAAIHTLERLGWDELFATNWTVGRREFQPVPSPAGRNPRAPWVMFALWEWNDAWQTATPEERLEYDRECDVAFASDVASGVSIAGRHRMDIQSSWHHLGIWECPTLDHLTVGMAMHEHVADFKFTTSRHHLGRRLPMADYFGDLS